MKRKICFTILVLSGCLMMVFAAGKVDPCTEKYNSCIEICGNQKAQAIARGSTTENAEMRYKACMSDCEAAKKTCETKKK
jgi:hypothetical protein